MPDRVLDIASATVRHFADVARNQSDPQLTAAVSRALLNAS